MSAIIEAARVRFRYAPGQPEALCGVSVTVGRGEFVALLGQNGAGKTTLAKHFTGLHRPTAGEVSLAGRAVSEMSLAEIARTVGFCYQNPDHQIFSSSVDKEVRFGPRNLGCDPARTETLVAEALELVGLAELREAHPFSLGRGQRQLLAVASILAMDPPVLVIDEPTTGMDRTGATRIMELLARWCAAGRTIVVITHDMDIVAEYVPRTLIMAGGRLIADGPTMEVLGDRALLRQADLAAPAAAIVSERLAPYGIPPARSVAEAATHIAARYGGEDARRLQRLP